MKILFVFGTRPEAIKLGPVIRAARRSPDLDVRICITGQHQEMLHRVLDLFCISPDHDLDAMQPGQSLTTLTARILERLRPVMLAERPDMVLVQGDTISALAGGLAAFFERIPVAHVEAGLRTHDLASPFPEEAARQMISRLATVHFAATEANVTTLIREGVPASNVFLTGNPGIDSVLWMRNHVRRSGINPLGKSIDRQTCERIENADPLILVTGHRRENLGAGLRELCSALSDIAIQIPNAAIVYPVHPNPSVSSQVGSSLGSLHNIFLLPPLDYPAFVRLMDLSSVILTDSGGIQEEAPALGKPVLVTRTSTERREAVETGALRIVGTNRRNIVNAIHELLSDGKRSQIPEATPFGDGRAAERIVVILEHKARIELTRKRVNSIGSGPYSVVNSNKIQVTS